MTSEFINSRRIDQTKSFTVTTTQDTLNEISDVIKAEIILPIEYQLYQSRTRVQANILDDDQPTITLSANSTSITEGDPLIFTLTRGNNTTQELIVGVSALDPGGFLEGNHPSEKVAVPSSVIFAPGDITASVNLTPPDDWRDIPDSTLTFTVMAELEYEITGPASITVPVADNDMAPQVRISFNAAEVDEGQDLILSIERTGEDKNPLDIGLTTGPPGHQSHRLLRMDAGQSLLTRTFNLTDDDYKGPDTEYEATLHPGPAEFWDPGNPHDSHGQNPGQRPLHRRDRGHHPRGRRGTGPPVPGCTTTDIPETG